MTLKEKMLDTGT